MLKVTLDSNVLKTDFAKIRAAAGSQEVELAYTTVTLREDARDEGQDEFVVAETGVYDESTYDSGAVYAETPHVYETLVLGESRIGLAVIGGDASPFEAILKIISNGSFPKSGERENLTRRRRAQLRDAMILEAHTRERRDILVSNDATAYIGKGGARRQLLETVCQTKILTVSEFLSYLGQQTIYPEAGVAQASRSDHPY